VPAVFAVALSGFPLPSAALQLLTEQRFAAGICGGGITLRPGQQRRTTPGGRTATPGFFIAGIDYSLILFLRSRLNFWCCRY
jgi:hypothetical protein